MKIGNLNFGWTYKCVSYDVKGRQIGEQHIDNCTGPNTTICFHWTKEDLSDRVETKVRTVKGDQFIRSVGRKKSFAKLLKACNFSREQRAELWNEYHSKFPFNEN